MYVRKTKDKASTKARHYHDDVIHKKKMLRNVSHLKKHFWCNKRLLTESKLAGTYDVPTTAGHGDKVNYIRS